MMKNITFVYTDLANDPQAFDWQAEIRLVHDTEVELEEWVTVTQALIAFYQREETRRSAVETFLRAYLDICAKVEGIDGVNL